MKDFNKSDVRNTQMEDFNYKEDNRKREYT